MNDLAVGYQAAGQLDKALPLLEETLTLTKAKLGADHPNTLGSMNNLALGYQDARQLDKALPLLEETLTLKKAKLGADHPDTLNTMNNLANGYHASGQRDKALPLFEETLKLRKATLGPDHPETLAVLEQLISAYRDSGGVPKTLDTMIPAYESLHKKLHDTVGEIDRRTVQISRLLASMYFLANRGGDAEKLLVDSLNAWRMKTPTDTVAFSHLLAYTGETLADNGRLEPAEKLLRECLALRKRKASDTWFPGFTQMYLGRVLSKSRKPKDAIEEWVNAYAHLQKHPVPKGQYWTNDQLLSDIADSLSSTYRGLGQHAEVAKWQCERAKYPKELAPPPRVVN
jgi:tetratricopeptide (TPR) repeat protein